MAVAGQLVAFAVFSLASIPLWRRFARRVEKPVDQPFLNRRAEAFVGREFTLEKPIVAGTGTVRIDDTIWRLSGPDCAGRQPRQGRARRRRGADGGAGGARDREAGPASGAMTQVYATPARSRSCRCTMPTGLPASTTNTRGDLRRVEQLERLADELIGRDRLRACASSRRRPWRSSRSGPMWRRRSPSVMMPIERAVAVGDADAAEALRASSSTIASDIAAPSGDQRHGFAGVHHVADEFELRAEPPARMQAAEVERREAAAFQQRDRERVAERELHQRGRGRREIVRAGFARLRQQQHDVGGLRERARRRPR